MSLFKVLCPKCGCKMKHTSASTNGTKEYKKLIRSKKYYVCPNCNGVLMK